MNIFRLFLAELAVALVGAGLIAGIYIWILPKFFDDSRTYGVLMAGLVAVAVLSGFVGRQSEASIRLPKWLLILSASGGTTAATYQVGEKRITGITTGRRTLTSWSSYLQYDFARDRELMELLDRKGEGMPGTWKDTAVQALAEIRPARF